MAYTTFRPRGDIKLNWETVNPVLREREMGIEWQEVIGHGRANLKFGTGYTTWNDLDYALVGVAVSSYDSNSRTILLDNANTYESNTRTIIIQS